MIRELFHIGPLSISPFGPAMVLAFLAAYFQLSRALRALEAGSEEDASAILLAGGFWGIVGAKVYYATLYRDWRLLLDRSGLVWYGGFVLGTLAVVWVVRRRRLPPWPTLDAAAPALAVGYGIGRIGCFLVGDDYGMPTSLPWGVSFPYGLPGATTAGFMRSEYGAQVAHDIPYDQLVRVHPTQLYETAAALAVWGFALWLLRRRPVPGSVFLVTLALLGVERFSVEFLRAKDDRFFGGFTLAQAVSLLVAATALALLLRRTRSSPARA